MNWIYVWLCTGSLLIVYFAVYFWIIKRKQKKNKADHDSLAIENQNNANEEGEFLQETEIDEPEIEGQIVEEDENSLWKKIIVDVDAEQEQSIPLLEDQLIEKIDEITFTMDLTDLNHIARMTNNKKITKEDFIRMLEKRFK
jgi:Ca2+/Na+ antiporter